MIDTGDYFFIRGHKCRVLTNFNGTVSYINEFGSINHIDAEFAEAHVDADGYEDD